SESLTASAKACACQGSAKTGPPLSRGSCGNATRASDEGTGSGCVKVVIPHVHVNGILQCGLVPPQFSGSKSHGINMLRLLTKQMSVGVWKNKNSMVAVNRPEFSAHVSRQPSVSYWMDVPSAHLLAHPEPCRHIHVPARRHPLRN